MLQYLHERARAHMRVKFYYIHFFFHIYGAKATARARIAIWWSFKRWTNWKTSFYPLTTTHLMVCEMTVCDVCKQMPNKRIGLSSDRESENSLSAKELLWKSRGVTNSRKFMLEWWEIANHLHAWDIALVSH